MNTYGFKVGNEVEVRTQQNVWERKVIEEITDRDGGMYGDNGTGTIAIFENSWILLGGDGIRHIEQEKKIIIKNCGECDTYLSHNLKECSKEERSFTNKEWRQINISIPSWCPLDNEDVTDHVKKLEKTILQAISNLQGMSNLLMSDLCSKKVINGLIDNCSDELAGVKNKEVYEQSMCNENNKCCDRAGEYNGFASGPLVFICTKGCPCHD